MKREKHSYFKDDIRKMLLVYAIIPVLLITLVGLIAFWGIWHYSIEKISRKDNAAITEDLTKTVSSYSEVLNQLVSNNKILNGELDRQERVKIFQKIYSISNQLDRKGSLYIFDQKLDPVITATQQVPEYLNGEYNRNWGIFRIMNRTPDEIALKMVEEEISKDMQLLIGKAIIRDGEIRGYAIFVIDSKQFESAIGKMDSETVISDEYGWVYLSNNHSFYDDMKRVDISKEKTHGKIVNELGVFYVTSNSILNNRLYIYSILPLKNQIIIFKCILYCLLAVFAMLVVAILISTKGLAIKKTKDLDTIIRGLEKVKEGNLETHIDITSNDEFEIIGESYNLMIDSLKEQIERNYEMSRLVSFSQNKQLESQFNPHFLFNTLENIRFMCKLDAESASKMVLNLSTLLRYSISNTQEEVTIKEDLIYTENYMSILKYRFNQRFHYIINIPTEVQLCVIPKLIIQPMIENAIKYGFEGKEHLLVEVNGYIEDNKLILQCFDDGAGMKPETLEEMKKIIGESINRSNHSGLYNIHRRVQLRYGEGYGIQIESELGCGTCLKVLLPVKFQES